MEASSPNEPSIIRALILGGAGEIGMNCLLLQEGKRLIMIDCGVGFPSQFLLSTRGHQFLRVLVF